MDSLISQLKSVAKVPALRLHTVFSQRFAKYQRKLLSNGPPKKTLFGFLTSLKGKILLLGSKLTLKVYLLVAQTNVGQLSYQKLRRKRLTITTSSEPFPHIIDQSSAIVYVVACNWLTATSTQQWTNTNYPGYRTQFITSQTFEEKLHNLQ